MSSIEEEEEEEAFEPTLVGREVSVFGIPPLGYKCGEWPQSEKIWSGRLRVVSCGDRCEVRLEDPSSGWLYGVGFVLPGQLESSVETAIDSSRYFVIKKEDGKGKHAFIGLGFNERNEAFDFNVALSDHEKYLRREHEKESDGVESDENSINIHPAVNQRLKITVEGVTMILHSSKFNPSSNLYHTSIAREIAFSAFIPLPDVDYFDKDLVATIDHYNFGPFVYDDIYDDDNDDDDADAEDDDIDIDMWLDG